jgi:hypothetical protein
VAVTGRLAGRGTAAISTTGVTTEDMEDTEGQACLYRIFLRVPRVLCGD